LFYLKPFIMKNFFKLIAFFALLFVGTGTISSQVKYNVQAGLNISEMTNSIVSTSSKLGLRAGLGLNYNFSKLFSVDPSLLIVSKGFRQPDLSYKVSPLYLQLPINATLNLPLTNDIKILVGAGPYVAYGVGGKGIMKVESGEILDEQPLFSNNMLSMTTYKNRFDAGLNANIGVMFGDIVIYIGGDFGFIPVNELDFDTKNYNSSFYLMLSYRF